MENEIVVLSNKATNYVDLYENLIARVEVDSFDKILSVLFLKSFSVRRRLNRIKKIMPRLDDFENEAVERANDIAIYAKDLITDAISKNEMAIGRIAREEENLKICRVKLEGMLKEYKDTLKFIKEHNALLPEKVLDWKNISLNIPMESPGLFDLVVHQQRWSAILDQFREEEILANKIMSSKISWETSSKLEQICKSVFTRFEAEKDLIKLRFSDLKSMINIGELEELKNLTEKQNNKIPSISSFKNIIPLEFIDEEDE